MTSWHCWKNYRLYTRAMILHPFRLSVPRENIRQTMVHFCFYFIYYQIRRGFWNTHVCNTVEQKIDLLLRNHLHSVHLPLFYRVGVGGLSLRPNFQKGRAWQDLFLEGVAWKEGVTFFRGGCSFYKKIN